jgi:hypothetical protein
VALKFQGKSDGEVQRGGGDSATLELPFLRREVDTGALAAP